MDARGHRLREGGKSTKKMKPGFAVVSGVLFLLALPGVTATCSGDCYPQFYFILIGYILLMISVIVLLVGIVEVHIRKEPYNRSAKPPRN